MPARTFSADLLFVQGQNHDGRSGVGESVRVVLRPYIGCRERRIIGGGERVRDCVCR